MKLDGIVAFVAVAEAGSISEAARQLRLSKSVVSERVAELERSVGSHLLHRTTRKLFDDRRWSFVSGAGIAHRAGGGGGGRRSCRASRDTGRSLAALRAGDLWTYASGAGPLSFLVAHPQIELTLDLDDRRVDAAADAYDAVIRHGPMSIRG